MKKIFPLSFLFLFLFITGFASAQQRTDEQKDIWKTVQTFSYLWNSNNLAELYNYFDDSYWALNYDGAAMLNKTGKTKWMNYWGTKEKGVSYFITPFKIRINGNFAYVHYIYKKISKTKDGKVISDAGHYTDILIKKNGRWLIVGDHGDFPG